MARGSKLGGLKNAGAWPGYDLRQRCTGCRRRIFYGDRCPPCATLLRIRTAKRRRKR